MSQEAFPAWQCQSNQGGALASPPKGTLLGNVCMHTVTWQGMLAISMAKMGQLTTQGLT